MAFDTLLYAVDDRVATITINRPESLNALTAVVLDELTQAFGDAEQDPAVAGVVLTGAGPKSFVAGADIKQFTTLDGESGYRFALAGQAVFNRIEGLSKPVVAAVNGFALGGGCELALACHLRIASETASFGQPEVNLGIIPGYGGTQRLPRIVGHGIALELILTGERIDARRAYEIGLANKVVPPESLLDEARRMVHLIGAKAPLAVAYALEASRAAELPLAEGLRQEATLFGRACATHDFKEGVEAFLGRRAARFSGR
ncbi:MAG: enoyl-CoA hydratase-related protein [Rhodothermales bacterium]|nr:enoyl-CoA hydratase-related protein [Rhodothermales bacterium]